MPRQRRLELVGKIGEKQDPAVVCDITSDRRNLTTQMAGGAIRPLYSHLEKIGARKRITDIWIVNGITNRIQNRDVGIDLTYREECSQS